MPDDLDELRRVRPAQDDAVARGIQARVRAALVGGDAPATRIDRFTVLEVVGSGGMGVVYAAYDPKLDRRVAIKVLHVTDERARDRVRGEARSLARLSHPNVVTVYDASDAGDDLYIAMEYVPGQNLRRHLAANRPAAAEILAIFAGVGRGIAAAHAAGLVHGDLKPENILVVDGGGAKVVDFGLARTDASPGVATGTPGTPAYMPPAQLAGAPADAASDQFAFAATLYEALAGERPFRGGTVDELTRAIRAGEPRPIAGVPTAVSRALTRALRADPGDRYPALDALLAALAPPPRRWRTAVIAGVIPLATVAAVIALRGGGPPPACTTSGQRLAAAWPAGFADRLDPRVVTALRDYGTAWTRMADEVCVSTRRGEQSAAMLDLRMGCLDRRLDELGALADTLARQPPAAPRQVALAREAVYALSPLESCADRALLAGVAPPPAAIAPAVAALRRRIDHARGQEKTRAEATAAAEVTATATDARQVAYPAVLAEALLVEGTLELRTDRLDAAAATLAETARIAATARDDDTLTRAWAARAYVANQRGEFAAALAFAEAAEVTATRLRGRARIIAQTRMYAADAELGLGHLAEARADLEYGLRGVEVAGSPDAPIVGEILNVLADVCMRQGELALARTHAERAVAVLEATYGAEHQDVSIARLTLAVITEKDGDLAAAIGLYREVVRRSRAYAGDDHTTTAIAHTDLGDALRRHGDYAEAGVELAAAHAIWARTVGFAGVAAIQTLSNEARLATARGEPAAARRLFEDVLARRIAIHGEYHAEVGDTLNDLGNVAKDAGDLAAAVDFYTRALHTYERALGPDHPRVPIALSNLGEAAIAGGQLDRAVDACQRALELDARALGDDHPDLAYDLTCLGEARLGQRDAATALPLLERAVALREPAGGPPAELARTRFALAEALGPGARPRARTLAIAARDAFATDGAASATRLAAVTRWLAAHPAR